MDSLKTKAPGILLCAIIAAIATLLSAFRAGSFSLEIVGAPVFAILMGMILTLIFPALSGSFVPAMKWLAKFFIAMAMCAIGLNTNLVELIREGGKPILMGLCCWCAIALVSLGVQLATGMFYTNL